MPMPVAQLDDETIMNIILAGGRNDLKNSPVGRMWQGIGDRMYRDMERAFTFPMPTMPPAQAATPRDLLRQRQDPQLEGGNIDPNDAIITDMLMNSMPMQQQTLPE